MAGQPAFVQQVVSRLNQVAPVTARAMFGGHGLYAEGVMFALIAGETLYFKVDDQNREAYLAAGSEPFTYDRNGKFVQMSYYRLPDAVFEEVEQLAVWVEAAQAAARRGKSRKR